MALFTTLARPLAALGFAVILLAGCSTTLVLDNNKLQQELTTGLANNGITATVSCPDDVAIQQGKVSTCTATTPDGTNLTIQVTQTDSNGTVSWQLVGS
jgi:Domain of unknown function (DUF4333)